MGNEGKSARAYQWKNKCSSPTVREGLSVRKDIHRKEIDIVESF